MNKILKSRRLSQDRLTEYQIEYSVRGKNSEYRMRRGAYGTWTRWFSVEDLEALLKNCGFTSRANISLLTDYFVESHFGRGYIRLNYGTVLELSTCASVNAVCRHIYSRVKQVDDSTWQIPSTAVETTEAFWYLYDIMRKFVK